MPDWDHDLIAPGWRPEYTGNEDLGNVGHGVEFGADLYYLYRAGRNELPATARTYFDLTTSVHGTAGHLRVLSDAPGRGPTAAHDRLRELRDELHDVMRLTSIRLMKVGAALVETAAAYAATDEEAVDEFSRLLEAAEQDPDFDDYGDFQGWGMFVPAPPPVDAPPAVTGPPPPDIDWQGPPWVNRMCQSPWTRSHTTAPRSRNSWPTWGATSLS